MKVKEVKVNINKIMEIPANTERTFPHVVSWFFSMVILFSFIYVCEMTGI